MRLILLFGFLFLSSCNFTPKLQQEILLAQDLISKGEYKNATGLYEKILTMNMGPELRVKILYQLADLYSIFLGDAQKGKKYYSKVFEVTSEVTNQIKALERIGELNFTYLKDYKEALATYQALLKIAAPGTDLNFFQYRMALSYFHQGNYEQAHFDFEKISEDSQNNYHIIAIYYLGMIHFRKSDWQSAINVWKKYLEIEKRRDKIIEVRFLMANAYETMENLKEAYSTYYSLLGEYPNTEVIQNRLKAVYLRKVSRKR